MTLIARCRSLIAGLLRRKNVEGSMADEMSFHIEAYTRDLVRSGVPQQKLSGIPESSLAESRSTRSNAVKHVAFEYWTTCEPIYATLAGRSPKVHLFPSRNSNNTERRCDILPRIIPGERK